MYTEWHLACLSHPTPRICSLFYLWWPVVARQDAFSTVCSIFFPVVPSAVYPLLRSNQLAAYAEWPTAWGSMCVHEHGEFGHCVWMMGRSTEFVWCRVLWSNVFLFHWQKHTHHFRGNHWGVMEYASTYLVIPFPSVFSFTFLHRHIIEHSEKKADLYSCQEDEWTRITFTDYSVLIEDTPNSWVVLFRLKNKYITLHKVNVKFGHILKCHTGLHFVLFV